MLSNMDFFDFDDKIKLLPTKEELDDWLFLISLGKSTNKLKVNEDIINIVKSDCHTYKTVLETVKSIQKYEYRVKSPDSIALKVQRYPDLRFQSIFNDILGIRICTNSYLTDIPSYFRVADMTKGKQADDGYRAQHLYYKADNLHYIIEIQIWAGKDIMFNRWSHALTYKTLDNKDVMLKVRNRYDHGYIKNESDFMKEVFNLCGSL